MTPKTQRRRKKSAAIPEPLLSPWKRIAAAAAFAIGGGGCAYWGIHDLGFLVRSLSNGAPIVETQSAMPGLPRMGLALFAIGALFLVLAASTDKLRLIQERAAVVILVALVLGTVLSLVGSPIMSALMDGYAYRSCEVRHGRRITFVTWAAPGVDCPQRDGDR